MATEYLLEALKGKQIELGISLRQLASELEVAQPYLSMLFAGKRRLTSKSTKKIENYLKPRTSISLSETLQAFIYRGVHKSPKTISTVKERLYPFLDYLARTGIDNPLDVTAAEVEGFLKEIGKGQRGKPLSPASLFGFTKDVQAFINYIADSIAPDDWSNPAQSIKCKQPQVRRRRMADRSSGKNSAETYQER